LFSCVVTPSFYDHAKLYPAPVIKVSRKGISRKGAKGNKAQNIKESLSAPLCLRVFLVTKIHAKKLLRLCLLTLRLCVKQKSCHLCDSLCLHEQPNIKSCWCSHAKAAKNTNGEKRRG